MNFAGAVFMLISGLAAGYFETGQYSKAEELTRRCLAIAETPQQLGNLAAVYQSRHKYADAERLYLRALELFPSPHSPEAAFVQHNLASLRMAEGRPVEAASYLERAVAIWADGSDAVTYAQGLAHLAYVYSQIGRDGDSERLWNESLTLLKSAVGTNNPIYARLSAAYRHRPHQYTVDYRALLPQ